MDLKKVSKRLLDCGSKEVGDEDIVEKVIEPLLPLQHRCVVPLKKEYSESSWWLLGTASRCL